MFFCSCIKELLIYGFANPLKISDVYLVLSEVYSLRFFSLYLSLVFFCFCFDLTMIGTLIGTLKGTKLKYKPGIVVGGKNLVHDCGVSRAIGYFLEPLIVLSLFGKKPTLIRLKGTSLLSVSSLLVCTYIHMLTRLKLHIYTSYFYGHGFCPL